MKQNKFTHHGHALDRTVLGRKKLPFQPCLREKSSSGVPCLRTFRTRAKRGCQPAPAAAACWLAWRPGHFLHFLFIGGSVTAIPICADVSFYLGHIPLVSCVSGSCRTQAGTGIKLNKTQVPQKQCCTPFEHPRPQSAVIGVFLTERHDTTTVCLSSPLLFCYFQ